MSCPAHPVRGLAELDVLAAGLARLLQRGDVVLLRGPLGAGKTTFAQAVGAALGVRERMTSPTFVIAHVHTSGRLPLVHVDAYRIADALELDDLDLDASLDESATLIEWGEGKAEQLSDDYLVVDIARDAAADEDTRTVRFAPHGPSWTQRLARLERDNIEESR